MNLNTAKNSGTMSGPEFFILNHKFKLLLYF